MSRIGKRTLNIPENVEVDLKDNTLTVKGPKGELKQTFDNIIKIELKDNEITTNREKDNKHAKSMHGTTNSLIENMFIGVTEVYKEELEIVGVGYRFATSGNNVTINAGYSNPVEMTIPEGITVESPKNNQLIVTGVNKRNVSEFAAKVRDVKKPEPYKGKGIRFKDEFVRRKEGKKAAK